MQPELTEVSHQRSSQSPTQNQHQSSNHGLHHFEEDDLGPNHSTGGNGEDESSSSQGPAPGLYRTVSSSLSIDSGQKTNASSSLNTEPARRSGSPVDRIIEHEKAVVKPTREPREKIRFEVIPGREGSAGTCLTDFPNGLHLPFYGDCRLSC